MHRQLKTNKIKLKNIKYLLLKYNEQILNLLLIQFFCFSNAQLLNVFNQELLSII